MEYNIRPISKIVSLVLFGPCLLFLSYATAFMPHLGFEEIADIKAIETGILVLVDQVAAVIFVKLRCSTMVASF